MAANAAVKLTASESHTLRTHNGHTIESQTIRARLREAGLKFCGVCQGIKNLTEFWRNSSAKDGRHGVCKACDQRGKSRSRKSMTVFEFPPAVRGSRYRDRMTPEELAAYHDRGNSQRDPAKWRQWYENRKAKTS